MEASRSCSCQSPKTLLENFSICPRILLAVYSNRLIPAPLIVDVFAVRLPRWVQLRERVAFVIGSDIKGGLRFLATDDESPLNYRVVGLAVYRGTAKYVFSRGFEASEEAA